MNIGKSSAADAVTTSESADESADDAVTASKSADESAADAVTTSEPHSNVYQSTAPTQPDPCDIINCM